MKLSRPGYRIDNAKTLLFDTSINNNNKSSSSINSIKSKLPMINNTTTNTAISPTKITNTTDNNKDILLSTNLFKKQIQIDNNPYSVYARNNTISK